MNQQQTNQEPVQHRKQTLSRQLAGTDQMGKQQTLFADTEQTTGRQLVDRLSNIQHSKQTVSILVPH